MNDLIWYKVGKVERYGVKRDRRTGRKDRYLFRWHVAYSVSPQGKVYPWVTRAEAREIAYKQGERPVFREGDPA